MVFVKVYLMFIIELKLNLKSKSQSKKKGKFKNRNPLRPEQCRQLELEETLRPKHSILEVIPLPIWRAL